MTAAFKTDIYSYENANWGDQLTKYNGTTITYDAIGNPLSYYNGYSFTWQGRELIGATNGQNTLSFTYNSDGLRTSKTVNGVKHEYLYSGSTLVAEFWGDEAIVYFYDASGAPAGFAYSNSSKETPDIYFYEKNIQGDIVAIYNTSGTKLLSYTYDAWGNFTVSYLNNGSTTTAIHNNLTYRGYYYDSDLGLYYLQSRFYDANVGRFINADDYSVATLTPLSLTDKNLYAYCDNNPIVRVDDGGAFWETAFDVVSLAFSVADVIANPSDPWAWAGLAGDVVDLIPFVSGVGEATDLVRVATKADDIVDAIDDVHDTAKAIDRIGDGLDTSSTVSKVTKAKGWQVGDDVSNLTKAGNEPSWTAVRQRYWKNQAHLNSDAYSPENLQRMKKGLAPIVDNAPMELHHTFGRKGANFYIFEPVTKAQHHFIHYGW